MSDDMHGASRRKERDPSPSRVHAIRIASTAGLCGNGALLAYSVAQVVVGLRMHIGDGYVAVWSLLCVLWLANVVASWVWLSSAWMWLRDVRMRRYWAKTSRFFIQGGSDEVVQYIQNMNKCTQEIVEATDLSCARLSGSIEQINSLISKAMKTIEKMKQQELDAKARKDENDVDAIFGPLGKKNGKPSDKDAGSDAPTDEQQPGQGEGAPSDANDTTDAKKDANDSTDATNAKDTTNANDVKLQRKEARRQRKEMRKAKRQQKHATAKCEEAKAVAGASTASEEPVSVQDQSNFDALKKGLDVLTGNPEFIKLIVALVDKSQEGLPRQEAKDEAQPEPQAQPNADQQDKQQDDDDDDDDEDEDEPIVGPDDGEGQGDVPPDYDQYNLDDDGIQDEMPDPDEDGDWLTGGDPGQAAEQESPKVTIVRINHLPPADNDPSPVEEY